MPAGMEAWLSSGLGIVILTALFYYVSKRRRENSMYPPCYGGWIPWLGCAIEFGKAPLYFIKETADKFGPVFTLKVAGKRMTFITDPEDYRYFFQSSNVDFQKAVQVPVKYTANISASSFFQNHTNIHDTVKWKLAPNCLGPYYSNLTKKFTTYLLEWGKQGCGDLNCLVRQSMYKAVIDNLFGEQVLPTQPQDEFEMLEKHFVTFDDQFEYGSQLPEFLLRDWSNSKQWLLNLFRNAVHRLQEEKCRQEQKKETTLLQTIIDNVEGPSKPNFSLMMLWASLANAIPITFWTLAFILSNPKIYHQLKEEVNATLGQKGQNPDITEEDLSKMPGVKRAFLEAIRLRSPGVITRMVTKDFSVKGFTVPAGDLLMLSPYWSHMNPDMFPNPNEFIPDRWLQADIEKNIFLDGFVAFGGGRYQCPGRWFALLEIHIYVALALHTFDFKLEGNVPNHSPLHLVGTQQPQGPCLVQYRMLHAQDAVHHG